jgi:ATP-binding cassette subfamily F protein 3
MKLGYFGQTNIQRLNPKLTIEQEIEHANPTLTRTQVRNICGTMISGDWLEESHGVVRRREEPHAG